MKKINTFYLEISSYILSNVIFFSQNKDNKINSFFKLKGFKLVLLKYKIRKLLQPNNQMLALHILRIVLVVVIIIILLTLSFELITNFSENKDKVKEDIITSLNNIKAPTAETNNTLTNVNYTLIT